MTHKDNIKAILECYFTGFNDEIIENACNRILEQEPNTGYWIEEPNCWVRCSCCGDHYPLISIDNHIGSNYCPNCGANMMESEDH